MAMETTLSSNIPSQEWRERHQCLLESHRSATATWAMHVAPAMQYVVNRLTSCFSFIVDFAPRALYQRNANDMAKLHGEDCDFPPVKL